MSIKCYANILILTLSSLSAITFEQQKLINHVEKSIQQAEQNISKITPDILAISGMSSAKNRHLLNNICSLPGANYLEIGVWQGSTFISALYGNNLNHAIAIDNWSEFNGPQDLFKKHVARFIPHNNTTIIEADCFALDLEQTIKSPINIYFYDGDHSELAQKKAFTYFNHFFADTFIAIVDDYCYDTPQENAMQRGTKAAFQELGYTVLYEKILPCRHNQDHETWWNGLYIAIIKK